MMRFEFSVVDVSINRTAKDFGLILCPSMQAASVRSLVH